MFRLRFANRFKADTKKIVTIDEYLNLPMKEAKRCVVQPKDGELEEVIEKAVNELGNNADLNFIDTHHITYMEELFRDTDFNGDISRWDVSNVLNMTAMFKDSSFNGDLSKWKFNPECDTLVMFDNCPAGARYGQSAEELRGYKKLSSSEMKEVLERMADYIKRKYSLEFDDLKKIEIESTRPDYGVLDVHVNSEYIERKMERGYHDFFNDMIISFEVCPEGFDTYEEGVPVMILGIQDVGGEDDFFLSISFAEFDPNNILIDGGYIEILVDELFDGLWDFLKRTK